MFSRRLPAIIAATGTLALVSCGEDKPEEPAKPEPKPSAQSGDPGKPGSGEAGRFVGHGVSFEHPEGTTVEVEETVGIVNLTVHREGSTPARPDSIARFQIIDIVAGGGSAESMAEERKLEEQAAEPDTKIVEIERELFGKTVKGLRVSMPLGDGELIREKFFVDLDSTFLTISSAISTTDPRAKVYEDGFRMIADSLDHAAE